MPTDTPIVPTLPNVTTEPDGGQDHASVGLWRQHLRALLRNRGAIVAIAFMGTIVAVAVLASLLAPTDPLAQDIAQRLAPPVWQEGGTTAHLLGSDELGRDILSRLMHGARTALGLAFTASTTTAVIGTLLGLLAGVRDRVLGRVIMWLADAQLGFPFVVLALAFIAANGVSLLTLYVVLSLFGWVQFARVVRAEVLRVKTSDYVLAAKGSGTSEAGIIFRHILPNVVSPTIVVYTFTFAAVILVESGLSFLGVGIQPPLADWGLMLATGRVYLGQAWWYSVFPGLMIFLTVMSMNVIGLAVRDVLNPRMDT